MAKSINLSVIAEGAETEEQAQHLQKNGCDQMQGYLFSIRLSANQLINFVKDNDPVQDKSNEYSNMK
ncbi:diguanylate cyclase (GGDEF) domain-containing protein [Jeotgalibacillus soli]|uniref:Diguanylate cyclase (GGDEF) domain-containing protein n=1 Tax=Jeotgalibacillus soli TaxID=889306 RepID=A0A0C2S5R7_9BACL|nr:diguanylate cyclase (GGDEF) domain-containing protein [Jeotgalibacillus soli]